MQKKLLVLLTILIAVCFFNVNHIAIAKEQKEAILLPLDANIDQDDDEVLAYLGILYWNGTDKVEKDYAKAFEYTKKAAEKGNEKAMNNLAAMYAIGSIEKPNYEQALTWYEKAADKGNALAIMNIGFMYSEGQGVTQSYTKAMEYYQRSASMGNSAAMFNIAVLYYKGQGVAPDKSQAKQWLEKSAAAGNLKAKKLLENWSADDRQNTH